MAEQRKYREGKAVLGVYIQQDLHKRIKRYMKDEKRTLTYVVIEAVEQFLSERNY